METLQAISYLRVRRLDLLIGIGIAILRSRNVLFAVDSGLCSVSIISSASAAGEVPSVDCVKDMGAEAMVGFTAVEAGIEPGFGACVLRFLGTGVSSISVLISLLDPLLGVFGMISDEGTHETSTVSGDVGGAVSAPADFPFALVIGLGLGTGFGAVTTAGVAVDPLLAI